MTAVFRRTMWKYHLARAYRAVLLDAGHLCQTFCLVATWLGLAPFCTAALKDTLIEEDLGIDGIRESVLYVQESVPAPTSVSICLYRFAPVDYGIGVSRAVHVTQKFILPQVRKQFFGSADHSEADRTLDRAGAAQE